MDWDHGLHILEQLSTSDIVIAPWLYWQGDTERLSRHQTQMLTRIAQRLTRQHWRQTRATNEWPEYSVTPQLAQRAVYETLTSTAAYLTNLRLGTLVITDEMVVVTERLFDTFIRENSFSSFLTAYLLISTFENLHAVAHYGTVQEEVFVRGSLHRPWIGDAQTNGVIGSDGELLEGQVGTAMDLRDELTALLANGLLSVNSGTPIGVELTQSGRQTFEALDELLHKSRIFHLRAGLMRASEFTNLEDYDAIMEKLGPKSHELRRTLIEWTGIRPGMKVLELGCGTGILTFEDGLASAVGPSGSITAIDPAPGMLARADHKRCRLKAENVQFIQARAESLPFSDNEFDAVIGCAFLHFTDADAVLKEAARVAKPGAVFGTNFPLSFGNHPAFFREWFAPIMSGLPAGGSNDILPDHERIPRIAASVFNDAVFELSKVPIDYSDPEAAVRFFVKVANVFEQPMSALPWQARRQMEHELVNRGLAVREQYGAENLFDFHEFQWIRGIIK
ncbi:class I SAM-dependent methyltransferase [Alicyclobacillus ferrooxydans]|uniref:class I SAM-dependent methyltransferase n=1 Tax=Alicyclobacillus ferrooxydans TaxID=471514 RepID=UPI0006D5B33F|nr:methyltransferase domain-containing protein [Alicyclobacillus ferrooxydans]